jgi:hypothetical protein
VSYNAFLNQTLNVPAPGVLAPDTLSGATITNYGPLGVRPATPGNSAPTTAGGSVTLNADGSFAYVPPSGFTGGDSFRYVLQNSDGAAGATVDLTVYGPPVAANASFSSSDGYFSTRVSGSSPVIPAPGVLIDATLNGATIVSFGGVTGTEQTQLASGTPTAQGVNASKDAPRGWVVLNRNGSFGAWICAESDSFVYVLENPAGSSSATVTLIWTNPPQLPPGIGL